MDDDRGGTVTIVNVETRILINGEVNCFVSFLS